MFLLCSNLWNHFSPFFCAEDVFVSTYLVSISSSAIYFMIGERRKRRKNTMGKTSVTENLVLDCTAFWLMQAGRATKKPRFCESNPCCELQRIKNFTHREKNGQILRKTTSTPHFFTCWIVVAGKHGQFQPVAHIIALLPMHTRIALRIQSHRPLYCSGSNPKLTKFTERLLEQLLGL